MHACFYAATPKTTLQGLIWAEPARQLFQSTEQGFAVTSKDEQDPDSASP